MGKVIITDTYLSNIADAIRNKTGTQITYKPSQMATAINNIPSGGESIIDSHPISQTVSDNYSSTTRQKLIDINFPSSYASDYAKSHIFYLRIRDKAGRRNGYFYGSDCYYTVFTGSSDIIFRPMNTYRVNASGVFQTFVSTNTTNYGIYLYSLTNSKITLYHAYSSSNSLTINGTFQVDGYWLNYTTWLTKPDVD